MPTQPIVVETKPRVAEPLATPNPLLYVCVAVALACAVIALWTERHWPLVHDAPLLHYVTFLMDHGWAPYRDILEINMPGTYLLHRAVVHLYGTGAPGWILWDATVGVLAILGSVWAIGPGRRAAGVLAGCLAYLVHASYGPMDLGQRDWTVAVLLLLCFASLLQALRSRQAGWLALAMVFLGVAGSIKPPVLIVAVGFLVVVLLRVRPARRRWQDLGAAALGLAVPAVVVLLFLLQWRLLGAFLNISRGLIAWYATLQTMALPRLVAGAVPFPLWIVTLGAAVVFWRLRDWRDDESLLMLGGVATGLFLYFVQRKGWPYHKYSTIVFLLLWSFYELDRGLRARPPVRIVAALALGVTSLGMAPLLLVREARGVLPLPGQHGSLAYSLATRNHLQADLVALGGSSLSGHVQCLDMTKGSCIDVLYRLRLLPATGYINDFYLFPQHGNSVTAPLQARFLQEVEATPPQLFVLSAHTWPGDTFSYAQVNRWPAFANFLATRYRLRSEYAGNPAEGISGYRLYTLKPG